MSISSYTLLLFLSFVAVLVQRRYSQHRTATRHGSHRSSHHHHRQLQDDRIRCATPHGSSSDLQARQRAQEYLRFQSERVDNTRVEANGVQIIPVCFHNPQRWSGISGMAANLVSDVYLSNNELQRQLDHMNEAFSRHSCCHGQSWCDAPNNDCSIDTNIQFAMATMDPTTNNEITGVTLSTRDPNACVLRPAGAEFLTMAYEAPSEAAVKAALRKGDASTLNVYFMKSTKDGQGLLGFSTFPWEYAAEPELDGVVIDPGTVNGAGGLWGYVFNPFNEGDTLVHEIG